MDLARRSADDASEHAGRRMELAHVSAPNNIRATYHHEPGVLKRAVKEANAGEE